MHIAQKHSPREQTPAALLPWVLSIQQGADGLATHPTALHFPWHHDLYFSSLTQALTQTSKQGVKVQLVK